MKLAVEFPSVSYREGPEAVMRLPAPSSESATTTSTSSIT